MNDLTRTPLEIEIPTGPDTRLLIRTWTAPNGRDLVTVAPQHRDRGGEWRLSHSGLALPPTVARALAPALERMADTVDAGTDESREP